MPVLRPNVPLVNGVVGVKRTPLASTLGRSFELCRSPLVSEPVVIWKGRPDEIPKIGDKVKSARKRYMPLSPLRHSAGEASTPLKTKRWRWSKSELARSRRKLRLSCGLSSVCKSEESSIECDQV